MLSDEEFKQLLIYFDRPYSGFRKVRKGVKKRLRGHIERLGYKTFSDYLGRIGKDDAQRAVCNQCLTVTISRFFRDRSLWDYLRTRILPDLRDRFPQGVTAWSAGCANGEEPYSLAIIWEEIAATVASGGLRILATDVQSVCLQRASKGVYQKSSLKEVSEERLNRWFRKTGRGLWQIDSDLGSGICWQEHQLLDGPPAGQFHLILLRNNLLTYYQGRKMRTALEKIMEALAVGGVLIIGSHERLPNLYIRMVRDPDCPWIYFRPPS